MRIAALLHVWIVLLFARPAASQSLDELRVGQWVAVKGSLTSEQNFVATSVEALPPEELQVILGTVTSVDERAGQFGILGLDVRVDDRVRFDDGLSLATIAGRRIKLEGHFRGGTRFDAHEIAARTEGRDRITGRIDRLTRDDEGLHLELMGFQVAVPRDAKGENEASFASLPLAAEVQFLPAQRARDDEDLIPGSIRLADGLTLGVLVESKFTHEDDYDLRTDRDRDVEKSRITVRPEMRWTPEGSFSALFSPRVEWNYRDKEGRPDAWSSDLRIRELWGYVRDVVVDGLDVQVGRQDFDDPREWIYKENLDAVRAIWRGYGLRLEASISEQLGEQTSHFDSEAVNGVLYLSNEDPLRHAAVWVVDRRAGGELDSYPIHFGARALGEWLPGTKMWIEGSLLRGYEQDVNLRGHAFDIGTTWKPSFLKPVYAYAGWAFGSGDKAGSTGTDESFRQTGLERNNGKLGGVTSFRYYGELVDPELSNLSVLTLGVGTRIGRSASIDVVWHEYHQDVAADFLRNASLDADPDGIHRELGWEIDVIAGLRDWKGSDFEAVFGRFEPGAAFTDEATAWKFSLQWRFRF